MATTLHFIDVGQGNMTLIELDDGSVILYDCNITDANKDRVLRYVANQIGWNRKVRAFVCSHRDADHMRGIKTFHANFPIATIWDSEVTGTTPNSWEYRDYMELRRRLGYVELVAKKRYDFGNTRLRILNGKHDELPDDANSQSIVIKVIHRDAVYDMDQGSVMLTGDTSAVTWKHIQNHYTAGDLSCSLLLGSHHGSLTYFDDPADTKYYYTDHVRAKAPAMTFLSVGDNGYGHPHPEAIKFYEKHSTGSNKGNKLYRTDKHGHIKAILKDEGGWSVSINCK